MRQETYALDSGAATFVDLGPEGRARVTSTVPFHHGDYLHAAGVPHTLSEDLSSTARVRPSRNFSGGFLTVTLPSPCRAPSLPPLHNHDG